MTFATAAGSTRESRNRAYGEDRISCRSPILAGLTRRSKPASRARRRCESFPRDAAYTVGPRASGNGNGINVVHSLREPMIRPRTAGILGTEHLPAARHAINTARVGRMQGHGHHRGFGPDA